jgi:hypothetical protein
MNSKHYKIGFSSDVHTRRIQLSRKMPYYVTILAVIQTPLARELEKEILGHFGNLSKEEWLSLDDWGYKLLHLVFCLYYLEYHQRSIDHFPSPAFTNVMEQLKPVIENHYHKKKPANEHIRVYETIKQGIQTDIFDLTARKKFRWSSHSLDD